MMGRVLEFRGEYEINCAERSTAGNLQREHSTHWYQFGLQATSNFTFSASLPSSGMRAATKADLLGMYPAYSYCPKLTAA